MRIQGGNRQKDQGNGSKAEQRAVAGIKKIVSVTAWKLRSPEVGVEVGAKDKVM